MQFEQTTHETCCNKQMVLTDSTPDPLSMAVLAKLAYVKAESGSESLAKLESGLRAQGFVYEKSVCCLATDTQAYIANNGIFRVLCFRGTEPTPKDFSTDLFASFLTHNGRSYHGGFLRAFESVQAEISEVIGTSQLPIYVTGHSLGGALATIAAHNFKSVIMGGFTFGAPPVTANNSCDEQYPRGFVAYVNEGDIVPRIMQIGPIPAFIAWLVLKGFIALGPMLKAPTDAIKTHADFVWELIPDFGKYSHTWQMVMLGDNGLQTPLNSPELSMKAFVNIFGKDWKRALSDHSIETYISRLSGMPVQVPVEVEPSNETLESKNSLETSLIQ